MNYYLNLKGGFHFSLLAVVYTEHQEWNYCIEEILGALLMVHPHTAHLLINQKTQSMHSSPCSLCTFFTPLLFLGPQISVSQCLKFETNFRQYNVGLSLDVYCYNCLRQFSLNRTTTRTIALVGSNNGGSPLPQCSDLWEGQCQH